MNLETFMNAQQAIARSISHTEIVTIGSPASPANNAGEIMAELFKLCEDCANDDPRSAKAEYWGIDADGNEWRVHVWAPEVER